MSDIMDFTIERMKRESAPHLQIVDEDGVVWFKYGADYKDKDNRTFTFYFWATGDEDAEDRLTRIQSTAWLIGRVCEEISA